jgi:TolB-like protein
MRLTLSVFLLAASLLWSPAVRATDATTIAVMYFENQGNPDLEMLKVGMAQMLITDLSAEKRFEVIERTRLNELMAELDLQKTEAVDQATAVNLGRIIGARYMVLGSYFELMGQLRVDARVVDVETSRIVSVGVRQPATDLWNLHDELVGAIADAVAEAELRRGAWDKAHPPQPRLRMRGDSGAARDNDDESAPQLQRGGARRGAPAPRPASKKSKKKSSGGKVGSAEPAPAPPTPEPAAEAEATAESTPAPPKDPMGAAIAFSEGLDFLDRKDMTRARKRFERALELDPELEDARSELASLSI